MAVVMVAEGGEVVEMMAVRSGGGGGRELEVTEDQRTGGRTGQRS